uniref:WGS project CBMI000000000 data, contig CS3069_c001647 n=1 Tax=Fusarium clavum TaxID=2594811 RepID=A0A090N5I8_9HYPO|nr:unnamed protein product [Fusarium clavum]
MSLKQRTASIMKSTTNSSWILYSTGQATSVTGTADPSTSQPNQLHETIFLTPGMLWRLNGGYCMKMGGKPPGDGKPQQLLCFNAWNHIIARSSFARKASHS